MMPHGIHVWRSHARKVTAFGERGRQLRYGVELPFIDQAIENCGLACQSIGEVLAFDHDKCVLIAKSPETISVDFNGCIFAIEADAEKVLQDVASLATGVEQSGQIDKITLIGPKVDDRIDATGVRDDEAIGTAIAGQQIVFGATIEHVFTATAGKLVLTATAKKGVIIGAAAQLVAAATAAKGILTGHPHEGYRDRPGHAGHRHRRRQ